MGVVGRWLPGIAVLLVVQGGALAAPLDYVNQHFGYAVTVPADLYPARRTPDNGDGFTATSRDPASELLVWGGYNALGQRSAYAVACPEGCAGETYRIDTHRVGISSGRDADGIYYLKCIADAGLERFACFRLRHGATDKKRFDPVVDLLGRSLRLLGSAP